MPGGKSSGEGGGSPKTGGTDFTQWNQECPWNLIVVNVDNPVPTGYDVITEKYDGTMEVDSRIMEPLCDMIRAARADGVSLWISSGYRSNQLQRRLYEDETASYLEKGYPRDNAESMAANAVAVPKPSRSAISTICSGSSLEAKLIKYGLQETSIASSISIVPCPPNSWQ